MTVNAVNGKQGWVNLETADITESPSALYFTLEERQQIIKLENQIQDVRAHTFNEAIHINKELLLKILKNTEHRKDDSLHVSAELKKKLKEHLEKLHGDGRRGLPGPPGPAGMDGASGSGGSGTTLTGSDLQVVYFDGDDNPVGSAGLTYDNTVSDLTIAGTMITKRVLAGGVK